MLLNVVGRRSVRLCGLAVLCWGLAQAAHAQITAATISGTVKDETGAVLPGVDVTVKSLDTGSTRQTITDATGKFTLPGLPPGGYEARETLQGFNTGMQTGIVLAVGQQAGLNVTLKVGT